MKYTYLSYVFIEIYLKLRFSFYFLVLDSVLFY